MLARQSIEVTLPDGEVASVQTRERGEFTVRGSMERRGVYGIQASFAGDDILEPTARADIHSAYSNRCSLN